MYLLCLFCIKSNYRRKKIIYFDNLNIKRLENNVNNFIYYEKFNILLITITDVLKIKNFNMKMLEFDNITVSSD